MITTFLFAPRCWVAFFLLLCSLLAIASAPGAAAATLQERPGGTSSSLRDFRPVMLAQFEEQLRRPEVQPAAGKGSIAVIYPNVSEPFRGAFVAMIQGIEERTRQQIRSYPVDPGMDPTELNSQLKRNNTRVVIALGRQGLNVAKTIDREISVLVGGALLLADPEVSSFSGISLTPDPAMLFSRLRTMLPEVRRVLVVYDPRKTEWLIGLAREAARSQGLELVAYEARDLRQAAQIYATQIPAADGKRDAIWLPHDTTTVEESTLLPLILKESWNSSVPIFSSNALHARKGALFGMSPNNLDLGRALAAWALGIVSGEVRRKGVHPLRDLQSAINLRTANHLGLQISTHQQRTFDFIYPEP